MKKTNRTIFSQIISGILKSLVVVAGIFLIIGLISVGLGIFKGRDISPVNDSNWKLQTINISEEENAFYNLDKEENLIDTQHIPQGKQLISDYLNSDEWDEGEVEKILADNEIALQNFTLAAKKGKFQLPYADDASKISRDMPVTALNNWRQISRISGIKAIWLAKNGNYEEALSEAIKPIIIGNSIENSQCLLITYLVGISLKDNGLDNLQKVISMIPKDSSILKSYKFDWENYRAKNNVTPFLIEYLISKQALNDFSQGKYEMKIWKKILIENRFYFKKNLTNSYYFNFFNDLMIEANNDCLNIKRVENSLLTLDKSNPIKLYFTENWIGRDFFDVSEFSLNSVLIKKCSTEKKLEELIYLIGAKE